MAIFVRLDRQLFFGYTPYFQIFVQQQILNTTQVLLLPWPLKYFFAMANFKMFLHGYSRCIAMAKLKMFLPWLIKMYFFQWQT